MALKAAARLLAYVVAAVRIDYMLREYPATMARGYRKNETAIISA
jgi:hypothetical protein